MDKIKEAFAGKKANIGYIVAGYPSPAHTKEFLSNLDESVIDLLEIGIPYSIRSQTAPKFLKRAFLRCKTA